MARPRIVIVGGAFAGCHAARTLSRLSRGRADTWTLARVLSSCAARQRRALHTPHGHRYTRVEGHDERYCWAACEP